MRGEEVRTAIQGNLCADSGYKYPIVDDIPVMLVEVGEKYKDVAVKDLPVPPPSDV